jgi:hypothetical protein
VHRWVYCGHFTPLERLQYTNTNVTIKSWIIFTIIYIIKLLCYNHMRERFKKIQGHVIALSPHLYTLTKVITAISDLLLKPFRNWDIYLILKQVIGLPVPFLGITWTYNHHKYSPQPTGTGICKYICRFRLKWAKYSESQCFVGLTCRHHISVDILLNILQIFGGIA